MSGVYDLEQNAKSWLADAIDNLNTLQNAGHEPAMDIAVHGVVFEFRVKPNIHLTSPDVPTPAGALKGNTDDY